MSTLLTDIETFLEAHKMAPTRFGQDALGDRHFVRQLREGRDILSRTERRVREFMVARGEAGPAVCSECDLRADAPQVDTCRRATCPLAQRKAA